MFPVKSACMHGLCACAGCPFVCVLVLSDGLFCSDRLSVFSAGSLSVFLYASLSVSVPCQSVCLSVCLYFCLSVCLSVCLSACLSYLYLHLCLLVCMCVLSVCLPESLFVCLCDLPVRLSIYLPGVSPCLSRLSVCLSVYPSVSLLPVLPVGLPVSIPRFLSARPCAPVSYTSKTLSTKRYQ